MIKDLGKKKTTDLWEEIEWTDVLSGEVKIAPIFPPGPERQKMLLQSGIE